MLRRIIIREMVNKHHFSRTEGLKMREILTQLIRRDNVII